MRLVDGIARVPRARELVGVEHHQGLALEVLRLQNALAMALGMLNQGSRQEKQPHPYTARPS